MQSLTIMNLLDLPTEILQQVVANVTPLSFLALSETCARLYNVCRDPLAVEKVTVRGQMHLSRDSAPYTSIVRACQQNLSAWLCFAVAHQKAEELSNGVDKDFNSLVLPDMLKWAPSLVISGHPIIESDWIAINLSEAMMSMLLDLRGIFCFAAAVMSASETGIQIMRDGVFREQESRRTLHRQITQTQSQWKLFRAMGAFALMIHIEAPQVEPTKPPRATNVDLSPVDLSYQIPIPFLGSRKIADDAQPTGFDIWLEEHCAAASSHADYLTDGNWEGRCLIGYDEFFTRWFPLRDVCFSLEKRDGQQSHFVGTGKFHIRVYRISMDLNHRGQMKMKFEYDEVRIWWECALTPLGIYATLEGTTPSLPNGRGALWLWKESWSR